MERFSKPFTGTTKIAYWQKSFLWTVFLTFVWSFLWFWPWQIALRSFIWLRLGIALIIFIVPGFCIYGLLKNRQGHWADHFTFGFVFSHLIIALAGTIGRFVHVSFGLIIDLMMGLGLIFLLRHLLPMVSNGISIRRDRFNLGRIASAWPLILIAVLTSLIVIQRVLSDDDLTYLAYITNWQHSTHLDFKDLIFGADQVVQPRFWLVSTPFAQAFLAEMSRLPGILIVGGYYEPFLVLLSMLCWYGLARTLGLSHQAASVAVVLQIVFLLLLSQYLHPGAAFFNQLSVDKATATFVLAPVFIQSEIWLLRKPANHNIILCLFTGLSLTFMHPVALAYSVFIGGIIAILNMSRDNLRTSLIPAIILIAILIPQIALRFVHTGADENIPYGFDGVPNQRGIENMISRWGNTPFYGFNPKILEMTLPYESGIPLPALILTWGWLIVPVSAVVLSIQKLRQNNLAQYIFSGFLLCMLAGLPLTGWIFGYFLSAWMLERSTWFFPYGLSAVFLLLAIQDKTAVGRYIRALLAKLERRTTFSKWPLMIVTFFSTAVILLFMREQNLPDKALFESRSQRYQDLASAGQFLNDQIPVKATVIGSDDLNDLIPGISWKAKILTFRTSDSSNMSFYPPDIINERVSDSKTILSRSAAPELRLNLLRKYDVRFLLLRESDYDFFKKLISNYPSVFDTTEIGRYIILKVR